MRSTPLAAGWPALTAAGYHIPFSPGEVTLSCVEIAGVRD